MNQKLRVAIIGFGHLGKWHTEKAAAHPLVDLIGIVESSDEGRERAKQAWPNLKVFEKAEEVVGEVDGVFIITPTSTHHELLKFFIDKGVHVFCEKPLTSSYKQALELEMIAKDSPSLIQVGHSERFHQIWSFKDIFSPYFEGSPTIRMNRLAPFKGRATDVDVVQDLMIHDLDLLSWLLKKAPKKVFSTGYKIRTDKWDYVCSQLSYADGTHAILTVGRNHIEEVRDFEITNSNGCFKVDLFRNNYFLASGKAKDKYVEESSYSKQDHLYVEHDNFYRSILEKKAPIVSFKEGLEAVRLVDSVLESLETGKEVILDE